MGVRPLFFNLLRPPPRHSWRVLTDKSLLLHAGVVNTAARTRTLADQTPVQPANSVCLIVQAWPVLVPLIFFLSLLTASGPIVHLPSH